MPSTLELPARLASLERRLWICLVLAVPVSSTPLLDLGSGTLARPLAAFPASALLLLALFRMAVLRQRPCGLGAGFPLLAAFTLYAIVSGLVFVQLRPEEIFKGQSPFGSLIRALLTWLVGVAFYFVARTQLRTATDIRLTIRLLFYGMATSIAFAGFQVFAIIERGDVLRIAQIMTDLVAVHYGGLGSRAQGMTFEPSWLATQIIVLVMPALIARAISRQDYVGVAAGRGFSRRLAGGFALALAGLLFSGSRFGIACVVGMLVLCSIVAISRGRALGAASLLLALIAGGGGVVAMSGVGAGAGAAYVVGPVLYLTGSADLGEQGEDVATGVTEALAVAGRVAAVQAAGKMWLDHPLFGVSLGNNYRYFGAYAPDWAFTSQLFTQGAKEGVGWLDPQSPEKGNAKNLFLRLLSETGLVGFAILAWFFLRQIFGGPARDGFHAYFRFATAAALGFSFLNQDTFVDPGLWIPLALCFAMNRISSAVPSE